jgi:PAS domain S-box-containing protein
MKDERRTREQPLDELGRSEERFRSSLESAPDFIAEADRDGRILFVNRTSEGVSAEEVIGTSFFDWLPEEVRSTMRSAFGEVVASGTSEIIEYHARNAMGEERWYSAHIGPMRGEGQTENLILVARDITEHKRAEEALRKSERQLSALADDVPALFSYVDAQGRYRFVNRRYEEWFGLSRTEILGKHYREVVGENTYEAIRKHIDTVLSGTRVRYEDVLQYEHGGARWVLADYVPDTDRHGEVKGFYALVIDITDRKRLEEALQESQRRLLQAQDVARMGFLDCSLKTGEMHVSPAVRELFGIKPGDVRTVSEFVRRVVHPDDVDLVTRSLDDTIRGVRAYNVDHRIVRPDGEVIWVQAQAELVRNAAGEPERLVGVAVNVTERKRLEQALQESEKRYRRIVETADEGIWLIDAESKTLFVNPRMTEILGYTRQEMLGESLFRFIDKDWQETAQAYVRRRCAGIKEQHDFKLQRKDGAKVWALVTASPILDETGQYRGALAMMTDITERKRIEQTLLESEERFRCLTEASPAGVFATDADGNLTYWNQRVTKVTGMSIEQAKGEGWKKVVHPEDRDWVIRGWYESTREGASYYAEHRLIDGQGRTMWGMVQAVPMKDAHGRRVGYVGTISDVTKLKEVENDARKARDQYLDITNLTGDIILNYDGEGRRVFVNEGACAFYGGPREELLGKTFGEYVHPDDLERTLAMIQEAKGKKGVTRGFVNRQKTPCGWRTVEWNGAWLRRGDDAVEVLQTTGRDVTDREQAQQALRESERRFRELFERISSGVAVYEAVDEGEDFVFSDFNRAAEQIDKVTREDVLGRRVTEVFPGVREFGLLDVLRRVWRGGEPEHHPLSLYRDQRIEGWRENFVYRLASGEVVAICEDMTQQKQADEALRISEARYHDLYESAPDMFLSVDAQTRKIVECNQTTAANTGYRKEEIIGRHVSEMYHPECEKKHSGHSCRRVRCVMLS